VDRTPERLQYKIREAQLQKIPFMLVVGDKEVENGGVAPRRRSGEDLKFMTVPAFVKLAKDEVAAELSKSG
jgi:threonyl-tRNA synthetase